jgi:hypothetical protein
MRWKDDSLLSVVLKFYLHVHCFIQIVRFSKKILVQLFPARLHLGRQASTNENKNNARFPIACFRRKLEVEQIIPSGYPRRHILY